MVAVACVSVCVCVYLFLCVCVLEREKTVMEKEIEKSVLGQLVIGLK